MVKGRQWQARSLLRVAGGEREAREWCVPAA